MDAVARHAGHLVPRDAPRRPRREGLEYLEMFARFPFALRRFLRRPITLDGARAVVRDRMEHREENFLRIVEQSIYGHPRSPYRPLLKMAGCELGDLRLLVARKGLEDALRHLRAAGVYITFEEFKGRKPIERHGLQLAVTARDFDNPFSRRDFTMTTGGSTGLATAVHQDLDYIAAGAPHQLLMLDAFGMLDAPMAHWMQIMPGGALRFILQRACSGQYARRWFSSLGWRDSKYWIKYDLATLYMVLWLRLCGARTPMPRIVRTDQALRIARWISDTLRADGRCLLYSGASHALRVCLAAGEVGIDLRGAAMRIGGEPITEAKVEVMRQAGVRVLPAYGSMETGAIGIACAQPVHVDEEHLVKDAFALITHPYAVPGAGVTVPAFNLTCLLDSSPKVLLNYQMDDYGVLEERDCGCALASYGYTTHLHGIRSYAKLVGESVTLIGNEMLRILEQVLPARFGGSPLDYQLAEQEDERGFTRLNLVISSRVDVKDERQVIRVMLDALRESSPMAAAAGAVWKQAETIRIKRAEPAVTSRGKALPLHIERQSGISGR